MESHLQEKSAFRSLRHRIGRRGACLLIFGLMFINSAIFSVSGPPSPGSTTILLEEFPLQFRASIWFFCGLVAIAFAFVKDSRKDIIGFLAIAIPLIIWCCAFWFDQNWAKATSWTWLLLLISVLGGWLENPKTSSLEDVESEAPDGQR